MKEVRPLAGLRWLAGFAAGLLILAGVGCGKAEDKAAGPQVVEDQAGTGDAQESAELRALRERAGKHGVEYEVLTVDQADLPSEQCKRLVAWNAAAEKVYAEGLPQGYCKAHLGEPGKASLDERLKGEGRSQGYQDAVLYEFWPEGSESQ